MATRKQKQDLINTAAGLTKSNSRHKFLKLTRTVFMLMQVLFDNSRTNKY